MGGHPLRELRAFLDYCRETLPGLSEDPAFLPWDGGGIDYFDMQPWKKTTLEKVADLLAEASQAGHPYWAVQAEFFNPITAQKLKAQGIDWQEDTARTHYELQVTFAEVANAIHHYLNGG